MSKHLWEYVFTAGRVVTGQKVSLKLFILKEENLMKLNQPKVVTWWIAVVLGALGLLGTLVSIPVVSGLAFWFAFAGFALLALGTYFKGL